MDNGSQWALTLTRLPHGGYVVEDGYGYGRETGRMHVRHFASASIDDALKFMRDKITPISPTSDPVGTSQVSGGGNG